MEISIKSLSPELLDDYLYFFDNIIFTEHPDWAKCYCYSFHFTGTDEQWNKEDNRKAVIKLINEGKMKGYLAYSGDKPVGWCNTNDRLNYQRLLKEFYFIDNSNEKVCSIVCYLISPGFRRKGIARKILVQIERDYTAQDYDYLEAYPGKGELSPEEHYKGPLNLYEEFGFNVVKEYEDFYIVRKKL